MIHPRLTDPLNLDDTVSGDDGNVIGIVGPLTGELTLLQSTLAPLQSIIDGLSGQNLNVTQLANLGSLLARLFNAIATLVAQLSTVTGMSPALHPFPPDR
jgi:hypothetical protein